ATLAVAGSASAATIPGFAGRSGDFNGDGRDDIVSFGSGPDAGMFVALSTVLPPPWNNEQTFGAEERWDDSPLTGDELPLVGDVDGDGKDDVVTCTLRNAEVGAVRVALSTGSAFVDAPAWH